MVLQNNILRKILWDGRMGHTNYLMFALALVNFILIAYNFLIVGNEFFEEFNVWIFVFIFTIIYFPVAVLIGRWHTNTQISIEWTMKIFEDPIFAKMIRGILDVQTGKATKEEIEEFRNKLKEIEKRDINEF
jgi:hypothetical protein